MGFDEDPVVFVDNSDCEDLNRANWWGGIGERGFAFGELEPEVVDVLGAWFDAPGGERVGGQSGFEPLGERLWVREGVEVGFWGLGWERHGGDLKKATRV